MLALLGGGGGYDKSKKAEKAQRKKLTLQSVHVKPEAAPKPKPVEIDLGPATLAQIVDHLDMIERIRKQRAKMRRLRDDEFLLM